MTASLLNPAFLTEFNQRHHLHEMQTFGRNLSCGRQVTQIKRNLFGAPKPAETTKHCTEQLEKYQEKATQKWGFDFRNGSPLNSTGTQFTWERVDKKEIVPQMYTLTRAAHVRVEAKITSYDLLLDERADRANSSSSTVEEEDSCEDSQDESMVAFEVPSASAAPSNVAAAAAAAVQPKPKRQPKITEYMKKRKRLAQTPKKISPAKRARTTSSSSNSSSLSSSLHSSFKTLQRNR